MSALYENVNYINQNCPSIFPALHFTWVWLMLNTSLEKRNEDFEVRCDLNSCGQWEENKIKTAR